MGMSGLNWLAALPLFALLACSILLPQAFAPLVAAIFLYLLPGYLLVNAVGAELSWLEEIALSVLVSIMVSTHAIYWLSMAFGYSESTFYLFFALVSICALFIRGGRGLSLKPDVVGPMVLASATAFIIAFILYLSLWVPGAQGVIVGGWNYGDYFLHLAIMQSINSGNFPPQEPIYAGMPLAYHWFADLHTAIVSKLLRAFPSSPSILDSAAGVWLLSLLTYLLALHLTKDRKASLLAAFLLVFSGGFGYLRLADELGKAPLPALLRSDAFDNKGEFFQLPSMLPGFLLPQRPFTIGLPAFVAVLLLTVSGYPSDGKRLLLAGMILGMMPPFHYYAFIAAAMGCALYLIFTHASSRSIDGAINSVRLIMPALIIALPFLLSAIGRAGGMVRIGFGWLAPKESAVEFIKFYIGNFGFAFLLAFPGFFSFKSKEKLFLPILAAALFAIPNAVTFSNTQWDMGKFFMLMMVPVSILAGAALARIDEWLWPILLAICCTSPILASIFYISSGWIGLTYDEIAAGLWIQENTPELSIFASSPAHNLPIDSVGGRLRVLGYRWWVTNYGLDFDSRFADLKELYCGPRAHAPAIMERYNATYVYVSSKEVQEYGCVPSFESIDGFTLEYSSPSVSIYRFAPSQR